MRNQQDLFDNAELKLLFSADTMRIKRSATEKMELLLQQCSRQIGDNIGKTNPGWHRAIHWQSPKISKGENYKGLPYLVLDHPRYYRRPDIFSFRILFWWGRYFCCSLHLGGKFLEVNRPRLIANQNRLRDGRVHLGIGDNPWEYVFSDSHYKPLDRVSSDEFERRIMEMDHLKVSIKWPLDRWHDLPAKAPGMLALVTRLLE